MNPETFFHPFPLPFGYVQFLNESKDNGWQKEARLKDPTTKQNLKENKYICSPERTQSMISNHVPLTVFLIIGGNNSRLHFP